MGADAWVSACQLWPSTEAREQRAFQKSRILRCEREAAGTAGYFRAIGGSGADDAMIAVPEMSLAHRDPAAAQSR